MLEMLKDVGTLLVTHDQSSDDIGKTAVRWGTSSLSVSKGT